MKLTKRQLTRKMALAVEYVEYAGDASRTVRWIDHRKVAYMDMLTYWFEYGRRTLNLLKQKEL